MSIIRKIAILCLFLCCSYIIGEKAQAEIHWTTISNGNPKDIQELDIENDGITDLTLSIIDNVAIFDGEHFIIKMAKAFGSPNLTIMSCQPGNKGALCGYITDNGQTNGWWNNGPKYLGFKRILNNGIYYGWLKVELTNAGWQIFEYAYEDCPTVAILSGAKQGGANCPTVTAITRTKSSPTKLNEINFKVTFSHNVTAVDLMDFALTTTHKINGASIIKLSGNNDTYIVTVNTGTGDGTIRLDLINNYSIKSTNNLPLKASFTDGEFGSVLEIKKPVLLTKIKTWYNGYSWNAKDKIYNPFSILNLFMDQRFSNYWFATGTPTFLMKLIKKTELDTTEFENKKVSEILFDSFNIENLNIFALLFQTGYLTITCCNQKSRTIQYVLNYPNF